MSTDLPPTAATGRYRVSLCTTSAFILCRTAATDAGDNGEFTDRLLVEPAELPALHAALLQVAEHPHFALGGWDTSRSWLTTEPPHCYSPETIAAANEAWEVTAGAVAVVIAGPLWNPRVYDSGAFVTELEYARLSELIAAIEGLPSMA